VIKEGVNVEIKKALETNRRSAFRVSLLLMPPIFDQLSLFHAIASLSYVGEQF
jgi:Phosphatidate cytidylyltransferase, mitochondrial